MSARLGVGSPKEWLCTRIGALAGNSIARLTAPRIDRRVVDGVDPLHFVGDELIAPVEEQHEELLFVGEGLRHAAVVEHP